VPRANRISCEGQVWHITHRCHEKAFLLKFVRDRRRWRHWLFEAKRRYGFTVLNYIATSNHVHLLCADRGNGEIPKSMQLIAGRTAQEFNCRKSRHGAFWEDRYHATAVQTDDHLLRCMTYIDLNMVRARVVRHPRDWEVSGYNEIQRPWRRKRVIDSDVLCELLNVKNHSELADSLNRRLLEEIDCTQREPVWTEAIAVGDEEYLRNVKTDMGAQGIRRRLAGETGLQCLRDGNSCYFVFLDQKLRD